MPRSLSIKDKLTLTSSGKPIEFTIEKIRGTGGSCIAYQVSFKENEDIVHLGILKEFCPAYLAESNEFYRDNGNIIVPEKFKSGVPKTNPAKFALLLI